MKAHHHASIHYSSLATIVKFLIVKIPSDFALGIYDVVFGKVVPASSSAIFPIKWLIDACDRVIYEIEPVFKGRIDLFDASLLHVRKSKITAICDDRLGVNFICFYLFSSVKCVAKHDLV